MADPPYLRFLGISFRFNIQNFELIDYFSSSKSYRWLGPFSVVYRSCMLRRPCVHDARILQSGWTLIGASNFWGPKLVVALIGADVHRARRRWTGYAAIQKKFQRWTRKVNLLTFFYKFFRSPPLNSLV